jgi:hypothetical protein
MDQIYWSAGMIYCERGTVPGLWAEPVNLLTNLAFILAGALALRQWLRQPDLGLRRGWDLLVLVLLLFAIGIGSGLWHAFAARWAELADVIPIALLINLFLLSFLVRVAGLPWWGALVGLVLYQAVGFGLLAVVSPGALNGSVGYLPALAVLAGMWLWLARRGHPLTPSFAAATGLLVVSLTLRTLDRSLCSSLPIGTHFAWHLLNAGLLYLVVTGLIRYPRPRGGRRFAETLGSRAGASSAKTPWRSSRTLGKR